MSGLVNANPYQTMGTGDGWIGSWSPRIGDPSWVGWLTVLLYFGAAWFAYQLSRRNSPSFARAEIRFWGALALVMVGLGFNKQLDLQSALTEFGRVLAREHGWYERRREVQSLFIWTIVLCAGGMTVGLVLLLRRISNATRLALVGSASLILFVVVRATSFHHVDSFLGRSTLGLRWNWILELGGLLAILCGAKLRRKSCASAPTVGRPDAPRAVHHSR